jgi:hypothetical protein
VQPLPDGSYEAIVLDVGEADGGGVRYELTLLRGEEKGRVVAVSTPDGDPEDLSPMGIGATLVVRGGRPTVVLDPP